MNYKNKIFEKVKIFIAEQICSNCSDKEIKFNKDFNWETIEKDFMIKKNEIDKIMDENFPKNGLTDSNLSDFVKKCTGEGIKLVYSLVLSNLAANGIVDCFWDDEENEMKFTLNSQLKKISDQFSNHEEFAKELNSQIKQGNDINEFIKKHFENS